MCKNRYKLALMLLSVALVLGACSNAEAPVNTNAESNNEVKNTDVQENKERKTNSRSDLVGKVKSVIGNEVVLELVEMPENQLKADKGQKDSGQKVNGGNNGNGGMRPEGMRQGNRELKLTGETATLLIPVGIPITVRSQGGTKEVDIADIYEGSMLQIWFDKSDEENKTITKVSMMQGRQ